MFDKKGQAFDVTVKFERDYNPEDDKILVHLVTGISMFPLSLCIQERCGVSVSVLNVRSDGRWLKRQWVKTRQQGTSFEHPFKRWRRLPCIRSMNVDVERMS